MNPNQQLVHQHQQQMAAQQRSVASKNNEIRRYVQQPVPNRPPGQNSNRNGMGAKNGKSMTSVTIEEVPNHAYLENGFRKMTPLSQGGLTRTESDQDHLEFSHPCFVQGRPELLSQIKRKKSSKETEDKVVNEQTQQSLEIVMAEMRSMREKAKNMEDKMNKLTKENRDMWNEMGSMRRHHERQQQYFKKLLHFLVSVMQPGLSKRVAKRSDVFSGAIAESNCLTAINKCFGKKSGSRSEARIDVYGIRGTDPENIHRASNGAGKRDHDGRMLNSGAFPQQQQTSGGVAGQKRNPYKHAVHKNLNSQNTFQANDYYMPNTLPGQLTYQQPQQPMRQNLMAIEDNQPASAIDPHQNLHSPTLHLSPSFDRQLSQEVQEYLNGTDHSIESFRDIVQNYNWNTFGDEMPLDDDEENGALYFDDVQNGGGAAGPSGLQGPSEGQYHQQYPLALKDAPEASYYDADGEDLMDPLINGDFQIPDQNFNQMPDEEIFPRSPVLRTPSPDNFI
ncbi:Protein CBR-HSF-1 [Caenorhabditis briggsae]|uniref:Protein CBR-HSF-1 n=1 Tax=Caenorhabditis briggsae TaxID=6238 RepID=A8XTY3_CAEBR|nr:Protein CBR-HSF-1 [Caenorhabditis briggsae]CAP36087.2 Protein CBR-HSF-1 [Caenorhabditis briggsae]